jgi:AcrR family transcriptional regulator
VHAAVLEATVDALYGKGFDTLSIKEVAERAEVHESSIYRRWETKADLVNDALLSRLVQEMPTPDTGSLRDDLLVALRAAAAFLGTPSAKIWCAWPCGKTSSPTMTSAVLHRSDHASNSDPRSSRVARRTAPRNRPPPCDGNVGRPALPAIPADEGAFE